MEIVFLEEHTKLLELVTKWELACGTYGDQVKSSLAKQGDLLDSFIVQVVDLVLERLVDVRLLLQKLHDIVLLDDHVGVY